MHDNESSSKRGQPAELTTAAAAGQLGTSGPDDQARGDTVTGLGARDVGGQEELGPEQGVPPGQQSGRPTPGNRFSPVDSAGTPAGPGEKPADA